jgi:hypothetical protein
MLKKMSVVLLGAFLSVAGASGDGVGLSTPQASLIELRDNKRTNINQ